MADWYMHWKGVYQKQIKELEAENEKLRETPQRRHSREKTMDDQQRLIDALEHDLRRRDAEIEKLRKEVAYLFNVYAAADGALHFLRDQYRETNPMTGEAYASEARPHIRALINALYGGDDG